MAGKPMMMGSECISYVLDKLSKNTLADIIVDRIYAEIGEDATDEQVLSHLQPWLDTIQRLRDDKPTNLQGVLEKRGQVEARRLERERQWKEKCDRMMEEQRKLAEKVDAHNQAKLQEPID